MELKKNPKVDLNHKKGMFFFIALTMALSLILTAFEWKTVDEPVVCGLEFPGCLGDSPSILPPPIPNSTTVIISSVDYEEPDEKAIELELFDYFDMDSKEDSEEHFMYLIEEEIEEVETLDIPSPVEPEVTKCGGGGIIICGFPDQYPKFLEGKEAMYQYLAENLDYPILAINNKIEGRVIIQFIINKDGSVTDVKSVKGIGSGCDMEAVSVVKSMPNWAPGKQNGIPVNVRMNIPVYFKLND